MHISPLGSYMPSHPRSDSLGLAELHVVLRRVVLDREPADLAAHCRTVMEVVDVLAANGFLSEATTVMAHALPRREAVWWACQCARMTAPPELPEGDRAAAAAAREWIYRPSRAAARASMRSAEQAGLASPETWAALAAFWSEPDSGEFGTPPHPAYLTGVGVAGALGLAAIRDTPSRREARLAQFLDCARGIAAA